MDFWSSLGNAAAQGFGGAVGGGAAAAGMSALNNPKNSRKENRKNFHQDMEQQHQWDVKKANLGRDIDVGAQQEMFDFRMQRGEAAGMTDYEMFMGPAAGAGGGTGAATSTLGNGGSAAGANIRQQQTQQNIAREEKQKDRMTSLAQTAMQTDAQRDVAGVSAGTQKRGQDIDQAIREGKLKLDQDTYNYINLPQAAQTLKKSKAETDKLLNEVATSDKKFVEAMKQLSMGPANLLVELTMRHHGIALNNESFMKLPPDKRSAILAQILALSSTTYVEGQGASALGKEAVEGGSGIASDIWSVLKNPLGLHKPIQPTKPNLGKPKKQTKYSPTYGQRSHGYRPSTWR